MVKKIFNYLIILFFCLSLVVPLAFSDFQGGKISAAENRTLASFPELINDKGKLAPGIRNGIESWLNDNIGFRASAILEKARVDLFLFHASPTPSVHIGLNGWYYLSDGNNLQIATGDFTFNDEQIRKIIENQTKIQHYFQNQGIQYAIVLVPSKVSVYPEYLGGNFLVQPTVIDLVAENLTKTTNIPIINLKPYLLQEKEKQPVFFKTDTHWNEIGSFIGYCAIIDNLNSLNILQSRPITIKTIPAKHSGDLSVMMNSLIPPEPYLRSTIPNSQSFQDKKSAYYDGLHDLIESEQIENIFSYQNPSAAKIHLLIYGDSFFGSWNETQLLSQNFSQLDFIWSYKITDEVVQYSKPDLVIYEITERYLTQLLKEPDSSILK